VPTPPGTIDQRVEPFAATQWSVILAAGRSKFDAESSRTALAQLCESYWPALYTYARAHGYSVHDAQDLTQGFFASLIGQQIYKRADRRNGKFRSFLLASFKNYLCNAHDHAHALKRGGGQEFVSLDDEKARNAESLFRTRSTPALAIPVEALFDRTWAETLVSTAMERIAATYKAQGKDRLFDELKAFLAVGGGPLPSSAELSLRMRIAESTLRSHVTRLRERYREVLRSEVRRTVASEMEVDVELRELLRVLSM
jgi:RNA polymerase sigma-70 factor (ECF subfamily)